MSTMEIITERINTMTGKRFLYRDKKVILDSFDRRGDIITFNLRNGHGFLKVEKEADSAGLFLDILKEIPEEPVVEAEIIDESVSQYPALPNKVNFEPAILKENKTMLKQLKDMLMADLKKVREDKSYIPQAKQACNTANSIIHLAKLEVVMSRTN
jgi:hypothetical protein